MSICFTSVGIFRLNIQQYIHDRQKLTPNSCIAPRQGVFNERLTRFFAWDLGHLITGYPLVYLSIDDYILSD